MSARGTTSGVRGRDPLWSVPADLVGMRFAPEKPDRAHVESWFLKANDPSGQRAIWVRGTIFARPGVPPVAEAWAIAFDRDRGHVATKSTVPLASARFARGMLDVAVDGCSLSLGRAEGALETGRRRMRWALGVTPALAAPIVHFPSRSMYDDDRLPSSKLVTPLSDARSSGVVEVDRGDGEGTERWDVSSWPTMIGHNWGRAHAHLYAWTHCSAWDVPGLVFEAVSARVRVGPLLSPMATAAFVRFRGERWDLGSVAALRRNRGSISLRRWEMTGEADGVAVTCEMAAETDDFVGLHYPNPSGSMTYCLNSKIARAHLEITLPGGERIVAASRAAALEIATRRPDHGVRMYV